MELTVEIIKMAQSILNEKGLKAGSVDGIAGTSTIKALNRVKEIPKTWSKEKKITALIQLYAKDRGIDPGKIDGLWGIRTLEAFNQLKHQLLFGFTEEPWRPEEVTRPVNPNSWPLQTLNELNRFYGYASPSGNRQITSIVLPYHMLLAWDESVTIKKISCHKKVKDSISVVLEKALEHYGMSGLKELRLNCFGGCLNYRPMRGGTMLSTHSWGIALDFDPMNNQLKWGRDKASLAKPDYQKWWELWESEGWVSLGRQRNYDWMHVQATKLIS